MNVFERTTLSNGLRVLTAPLGHAQSVACFVMLAAGSRYEEQSNRGIAHFTEHMVFKGTERRPTARDIAAEDDLERLRRGTAGERRVKRRAAAGKEHAGAFRKTTIADPLRHLLKPLWLGGDRLSGQLSRHEGCLYHRARWRSSRRRRSATEYACSRRPFHRSVRCRAS